MTTPTRPTNASASTRSRGADRQTDRKAVSDSDGQADGQRGICGHFIVHYARAVSGAPHQKTFSLCAEKCSAPRPPTLG